MINEKKLSQLILVGELKINSEQPYSDITYKIKKET